MSGCFVDCFGGWISGCFGAYFEIILVLLVVGKPLYFYLN